MTVLYVIFLFFFISYDEKIFHQAKVTQRPVNVYYRDYSQNLPNDQRDKLMKILLEGEQNEEGEDIAHTINVNKINEREKGLETLLKEHEELSSQIRDELKGYIKRNMKMSVKYDHVCAHSNSCTEQNEKTGKDTFDVDTQIEASPNSMEEPIVVIKIPSLNIYDQMEMENDIGNLIGLNNEELFY
ncbi:conserved Plasmodium protein, unknown function [Plasmodium ovale]|uniref:Secreted ookinete protein n=1 Tax=Plasmodium ovale TaxID=36330 RepID=A0A1D3U7T0_PLAOA|nr:conserved Plasmodium protein, unknown function [Plasmodium ovale]